MSLGILILLSAIVMLVLGYRTLDFNRQTRSAAPQNRLADPAVRAFELIAIGLLAGMLGLFMASSGVGPLIPIRSFILIRGTMICGLIGVTACAALFAIIRKLPISRIAFVLAGFLLVGGFVVASTNPLSYTRYVEEIRKIPVPVEISTNPPISNLEVIINGVSMGQTPLTTSIDDIIASVPARDEKPPTPVSDLSIRNQGYFELKRIPLQRANHVVNYSERDKPVELDFQFRQNGKPILIAGNMSWQNGSRMFGQIQPARISFGVMTKEWFRDTTDLLAKARLADYHVDREWISAVETFPGFIRPAIVDALPREPGFQQVLNDWATDRYHFDQATNSETAWQRFQSICQEADRLRVYHTDSTAGDAIELLLDKLDHQQVITAAEKRIASLQKEGASEIGWSWNPGSGKPWFSYSPSYAGRLLASDFVLAHVIWKLNQKSPNSPGDRNNRIQEQISPRLLRLSYSQPMIRPVAETIGGSVVDEFHRRLQRGVHGYAPSSDASQNEFVDGEMILRNFWVAINSTDHAGANFRRTHAHQAVELAKQRLARSQGMMSIPGWMNYLFLEVEGREPLARDVWKSFEGACVSDPASKGHVLNLKWNYLARMRPIPDAAEFISVVQKTDVEQEPFFNPDTALAPLPDSLKFEIASRTLPILNKSLQGRDPNSISFVMTQSAINRITLLICTIPSEEAAEFLLSTLDRSDAEAQHRFQYLSQTLASQCVAGTMTAQLLNTLSASDDAKLRQLVIPQLEVIPTTSNRKILQRLQHDEDPDVQRTADLAAERLARLQQTALPQWANDR